MAINFPNSPNVNDTHIDGTRRWRWNGSAWKVDSLPLQDGINGTSGTSGTSGTDGAPGSDATAGADMSTVWMLSGM